MPLAALLPCQANLIPYTPNQAIEEWDDLRLESSFYEDLIPAVMGESRYTLYEEPMIKYSEEPSFRSTAATKSPLFAFQEPTERNDVWRIRPVKLWSASDVMNWIMYTAMSHRINYEDIAVHEFRIDGKELMRMSSSDFLSRDRKFGQFLYNSLQNINNDLLPSFNNTFYSEGTPVCQENMHIVDSPPLIPEDIKILEEPIHESSCLDKTVKKMGDRGRGRPPGPKSKRKNEKRTGRLWEFIRDLLLNPEYCPSLICWENHDEGTFRFVSSDKVAQLWGTRKENSNMNYEKLSRAMRYYYKSKVFQPVLGRRLVYKFGPTATGWKTDNPNFSH